ncbi:tol-pal system protein YbgF [Colwellia sp. MT41]|uniref:Cell division coordinator CpoB n=1 Tax=Colwellia marinimaniae TaxID=1513592 RepID=A0ABQ0MYC4_9GAMM|nr:MULTISPECIES: tol-pal system protein YbgF [Colwellia]ALO35209.1 tol-pal system protein YbgF [Colwellia sp. MT41]GAW97329.1 tol-pal system protein YbgF [Colwellia marinimaniae]
MKLNKVLFGMMITASAMSALAVAKAPVIDVNANAIDSAVLIEQLSTLSRKLDSRNKAQVNIQRQLDQLQREVNELRGITELHTHKLGQVLERQRELYQEIDRRVNEVLVSTSKPASVAHRPSMSINTAVNAGSYSDNLTENEAYDRALNLVLKDKRYQQAILEFKGFNKHFPNSSYAPNAHYWLGQLLFNQGELAQASQEFIIVVNQHKESSKRPDALLKLAIVAQKQKDNKKAIARYQQLLVEYPESTAAKLAKPRLASLTN